MNAIQALSQLSYNPKVVSKLINFCIKVKRKKCCTKQYLAYIKTLKEKIINSNIYCMKKLIILFGAPGSGKGLLGDVLTEKTGITKISTGDILREEVKKDTPIGKKVASFISSGSLVEDSVINPILDIFMQTEGDILLDGYPRNFSQLKYLKNKVKKDYQVICVHVNPSEKLILSRIGQRRVCSKCGTTQFAGNGKCTRCSGDLVVRDDDKWIKNRITYYNRVIKPILPDLMAWSEISIIFKGTESEKNAEIIKQIMAQC